LTGEKRQKAYRRIACVTGDISGGVPLADRRERWSLLSQCNTYQSHRLVVITFHLTENMRAWICLFYYV